jgi:hypothetical protein
MSRRLRVVSPRIVRPRPLLRLLAALLLLVALGASFIGGTIFSRRQFQGLEDRLRAAVGQREALAAELAEAKRRSIFLERNQQIDREANRDAQNRLEAAQDKRLALEKEVALLKRLIREGGGGVLQIDDFKLTPAGGRTYNFSFTLSQLVQDFGESTGTVEIQVIGKQKGKDVTLSLDKLEGSTLTSHTMKFRHFQHFDGEIKLPEGLEPVNLVVEVKPTTKKLIPVAETFPWSVRD